jgi:guanine nucleotide exchange factor VAV
MTSAALAKAGAESQPSAKQNNDWLLCAKWLDDCRCLPPQVHQRLLNGELALGEFANALRDGEILCNLANFLVPGSVDVTQINKRAHNSQMLCLKNIRLFLDACVSPAFFNLDESDLFDEHMVSCSIHTLLAYFSLRVFQMNN